MLTVIGEGSGGFGEAAECCPQNLQLREGNVPLPRVLLHQLYEHNTATPQKLSNECSSIHKEEAPADDHSLTINLPGTELAYSNLFNLTPISITVITITIIIPNNVNITCQIMCNRTMVTMTIIYGVQYPKQMPKCSVDVIFVTTFTLKC